MLLLVISILLALTFISVFILPQVTLKLWLLSVSLLFIEGVFQYIEYKRISKYWKK